MKLGTLGILGDTRVVTGRGQTYGRDGWDGMGLEFTAAPGKATAVEPEVKIGNEKQ